MTTVVMMMTMMMIVLNWDHFLWFGSTVCRHTFSDKFDYATTLLGKKKHVGSYHPHARRRELNWQMCGTMHRDEWENFVLSRFLRSCLQSSPTQQFKSN